MGTVRSGLAASVRRLVARHAPPSPPPPKLAAGADPATSAALAEGAAGRTRRRTLRLAGIAGADVIAAGQGATLRIVGPAGPLDVEMLSSWEATLASELIAGLRDIADVQAGRSGDDHAPGAPGPARSRRARRSRRTRARVTLSRTAARPLAVASEREG